MLHVHIAADTFGRVKTVGGTSVVTRFWGVQMIPLLPTASYYVPATATEHADGVPCVAIPLARVDLTSTSMAYLRGLCGALFVLGFIAIVPLYSIWLNIGPGPDEYGIMMMKVLIVFFIAGIVGGVSTYFIPTMSLRERQIREYCSLVIGPAIDPARVTAETALEIQRTALDLTAEVELVSTNGLKELRCQLVLVRCQVAIGDGEDDAERTTDDLLRQLNNTR